MALVSCILGKFLGVACHCFPPLFRCSHFSPPGASTSARSQRRKRELWARMLSGNFAEMTTSTPLRVLLHAANLRHGTDGFTSRPKEGVLRIFSPLKIRRLQPGLNPRTKGQHATPRPLKPLPAKLPIPNSQLRNKSCELNECTIFYKTSVSP